MLSFSSALIVRVSVDLGIVSPLNPLTGRLALDQLLAPFAIAFAVCFSLWFSFKTSFLAVLTAICRISL